MLLLFNILHISAQVFNDMFCLSDNLGIHMTTHRMEHHVNVIKFKTAIELENQIIYFLKQS